ncbi:putative aluminum-activated malate transporter [Rosa chinensis]|uniref:Putative aluminum-activated malate transporter n=2 Tax=Rosa chinensis TaxID=74649 RepID=A0A2P6R5Q4_ROSCH|nr:putative aluminum-activated malate transporter [Rosa chinensis]
MSNIALKVSSESSRVIKELARTMKTMKKSSTIDYLVGEMNNAVLELQEDLKSLPNLFINPQPLQGADCPEKRNPGVVALMDIMPLVTLVSLLTEIATRIEGMVNAVEELAEMGEYKSIADAKNQNQPVSKTNVPADEHKEKV